MPATSELHIRLSAIDHNLRTIKRIVGPGCRTCMVVKSNAYGLGAERISRRLQSAGADMFAVFSEDEAAALYAASISIPILVLAPVNAVHRADELYRALTRGLLHLSVHDAAHMQRLEALASQYGLVIPVHLEIDTGMSRGGCSPEEAQRVLRMIAASPRLKLTGIFTHFAKARQATTMTDLQLALLDEVVATSQQAIPKDTLIHVGATAAAIRHARFHRSMVRVGLAWAGYGPEMLEGNERLDEAAILEPSVRWTSTLVHIKQIEAGTPVGYGSRWSATRPTTLGLVPVGYADGYPMSLACSTNTPPQPVVGIPDEATGNIAYAPVVGAISMDQMIIDLTDVAAVSSQRIAIGNEVELISTSRTAPNYLTTLATTAGLLPYELLSRLHPSVRRCFTQDAALIDIAAEPARDRVSV